MDQPQTRVALVTGSSRGLGRAIAQRLAGDGFAVAVNGIDAEETARVAEDIRGGGGTAEGLVAAITERLGPVGVLVLNATGPQPTAPLAEVGWPDHLVMLDFFVKSPILLGRAVLPSMLAARCGRIINVDSEVADLPPPGSSHYSTAKSAQAARTAAERGAAAKRGRGGATGPGPAGPARRRRTARPGRGG